MTGRARILVVGTSGGAEEVARTVTGIAMDSAVEVVSSAAGLAATAGPWSLCVVAPAPALGLADVVGALRRAGEAPPLVVLGDPADEAEAVAWLELGARELVPAGQLARLAVVVKRALREPTSPPALTAMTERIAAVGVFAAGLAHELNNPLAALIFNIEHAQRRLGGGAEVEELREAMACAERLRQIIRDMRVFARPEDRAAGSVDVHAVLGASLQLLGSEIRRRGALRLRYGEVPSVHGHDAHLAHALFYLLYQALRAMPPDQAGSLIVATSTRDDRVEIDITVEGEAVSAAQLDPSKLATCRAALAGQGGTLAVDGPGLSLRIGLPVARSRDSGLQPRLGVLPRVVIVDDDRAVAQMIRRLLMRDHHVEVLLDPRDALARLAAGERFEVIVCDLMMPHIAGPEFFHRIAALDPNQARRMVFMTGGVFSRELEEFRATLKNPCLDKPFSAQALAWAIAQARAP